MQQVYVLQRTYLPQLQVHAEQRLVEVPTPTLQANQWHYINGEWYFLLRQYTLGKDGNYSYRDSYRQLVK